ncbi:hypothetical protein ACMU_12440 [Actibacterium mucosum KCTC 23349]|uniref:Uncharacterized protein n=1 Tax=Actibacterium mucosum KCTC 23349 TaxID=1454373 RepID=A0A037ZGC3_9RHOB|nr:hypothetical protein [Actibacterium mucosum]KAJ55495.1 hypothetical protein ACMU_12440 [Actibacterium mucosum KCTC 23349]
MYEQDSFFTLSAPHQFGLLCLSAVFATGMVAAAWQLKRWPRVVAVPLAVVLVWVFTWISPQGYYQYYRSIIDGLPAQWVVGAPPGLGTLWALLSFRGPDTLSAHSLGVMGWIVIIVATIRHRTR